MFKRLKHPHKVLTGDVGMACQYLPMARTMLEKIRRSKQAVAVRKASPLPGVDITVKGGKWVPEHIHINADGVQWLAQVFLTDGIDEGGNDNIIGRPLYGSYHEKMLWQARNETKTSGLTPRIQGCGNGWAFTMGRSEQGNGWANVLMHFRGMAEIKSPDYWEYPGVGFTQWYSIVDYRSPVFCGFVNRGDGPKRRFAVVQIQHKNATPIPAGPWIENADNSNLAHRYLTWTEGDAEWEVLLPPDSFPATHPENSEPLTSVRYGPLVYLGDNTIVAWGFGNYGVPIGWNSIGSVFKAWRSYNFGITWTEIPDTDILNNMPYVIPEELRGDPPYYVGIDISLYAITRIRAYAFGEGCVAWHFPHVETAGTFPGATEPEDYTPYDLGSVTYIAKAGLGLERKGFAMLYPARELYSYQGYPPTVLGNGAAIVIVRDETDFDNPEFHFHRTLDYGATWLRVAQFPVNQYVGLSEEHANTIPSWPYEYYPYVAKFNGTPTETQLLIPLQKAEDGSVVLYRSEDGGVTWVFDKGIISPTPIRFVDDTFMQGYNNPVNIVASAFDTFSNPAIPLLDEVIDGT